MATKEDSLELIRRQDKVHRLEGKIASNPQLAVELELARIALAEQKLRLGIS